MRRVVSRLLAFAAAILLAVQPVLAAEAPMVSAGGDGSESVSLRSQPGFELVNLPLLHAGPNGASGPVNGDPTALAITSALWTSSTDLTPVSQFVDGYTGDLTIQGATPAGATSAYAPCISGGNATGICGSWASPALSFVNTWPGYDSSGVATTGTSTVVATSWLRQTYPNSTLPTEAANGGNAKAAFTFNDFVHTSDTPGTATALSGLYVSNLTSNAKSGIPVTNNSTWTYANERPIGAWVTAPGERIGSGQGITVEFFGGQSYGQNGAPLAAVKITACDAGCAHTVTKTVSSMTKSAKQLSFSCTGTNGSATLTSCGSTLGVMDGERFTVVGIPGQPRLLSHTSTSLTFGSAQTCVTTLNSGDVTVGTVASLTAGDALADGGFAGATLTDANITGSPVAISSETLTADITMAATKATAAKIHTGATTVTAAAAHACQLNHVYQGVTGTVTATLGVPTPVWSAAFASGDFSGFTDGLLTFRAQAYPIRGDVILDSQTGADGTGCDWFYVNDTGTGGAGVCDSGNAAWFNTNGTDVSANLHNLWAYLDVAGVYAPAYVWVTSTGTCTTAACVAASPTDPTGGGVTKSAASIKDAITALKAFNLANHSHNDASGGVICLTASASPLASMGADETAATTAAKPYLTITSATANGGDCSPSLTANTDLTVAIGTNGTVNNRRPPNLTRFNNLTFNGDVNTLQANEPATSTAFNSMNLVFANDKFTTAGATVFAKIGVWSIYDSFVDESANEGDFLRPAASTTGALRLVFGSTLICGNFTTHKAALWHYNSLGNIGFDCQPVSPSTGSDVGGSTVTQPLSQVLAYEKFMFNNTGKAVFGQTAGNYGGAAVNNFLMTHFVFELNNTNALPALQISGDNQNSPARNVWRSFTTILGGRSNVDYLEGVPAQGTAVASGGSFAANTYYVLVTYALKTNPTVETSTNGVWVNAGTFTGTSVVLNGSMTLTLECNPNYVATVYVDSTVTGAGNAATLGHYATVGGVDAKQLAMCQNITITGVGGAHTSLSVSGSTAANQQKFPFVQQANIDNNINEKSDLFGGTTGAAGAVASGGKVGNFPGRFNVRNYANIAITGSVIGGAPPGPSSGLGEFFARNQYTPAVSSQTDLSAVKFSSDRSIGSQGSTTTVVQTPALNLGEGNYCPTSDTPHGLSIVPSGFGAWPYDVLGRARLNDGTGANGAYERGCT